jgi:hypothetical protein
MREVSENKSNEVKEKVAEATKIIGKATEKYGEITKIARDVVGSEISDILKNMVPGPKIDIKIKCRNEDLAGTKDEGTGSRFEARVVIGPGGIKIEIVIPNFKSILDAKLPEKLTTASDNLQRGECNNQLNDSVEKNPDLAKKFNSEQLEQIKNGDRPSGYVWHRDAETGKVQLVEINEHNKTGHTGGGAIWGNGSLVNKTYIE